MLNKNILNIEASLNIFVSMISHYSLTKEKVFSYWQENYTARTKECEKTSCLLVYSTKNLCNRRALAILRPVFVPVCPGKD
jgi:hypothetical protein